MFPTVITHEELIKLTEQLEKLPKTIRDNIDAQSSKVTYEGLSTKPDKDLSDLVVYKPTNGMTFGVMFYDHDEFNDTYEVNPHKVNFGKDRETLQIGSTIYTAKIRRYVKDTRITYTLQLAKGSSSPLFVPYKEDVFLVLEPIKPNRIVEEPPLVDEPVDTEVNPYKEWKNRKDDPIPIDDLEEEVDEKLEDLFE